MGFITWLTKVLLPFCNLALLNTQTMKTKEIYNRIEFWLASITAASIILGFLVMSKNAENEGPYWFLEHGVKFNFWKHLFMPAIAQVIIFYCGYISISKFLEERKDNWTKAGSIVGLFLIIATLVAISNTYLDAWMFGKYDRNTSFIKIFINAFTTVAIIFIIFLAYYIVKEQILKQISKSSFSPINKKLFFSVFLGLACWIAILIVFTANQFPEGAALFGIGVPYVLFLYWMHIRFLIPIAGHKKYKSRGYLLRVIPIVFLLSLISSVLGAGMTGSDEYVPLFFFIFFLTPFVVLPLIWYFATRETEKEVLQTALGTSQANLSFLRSQINPHFLFNALNTLYGTALQENADRTGEGIQKLGDMMRFMLHENTQDKISLTRETEYLNNYIDLQKLRIAYSSHIVINTTIDEQLNRLDISPMLLIPFVENAFKHGISLQQPSFINISLHTKENILYFDVHNSVHLKGEYDPEKMKSGIGLQNVKQRLALLYPHKHDLVIRESAKEFFVHLTITL